MIRVLLGIVLLAASVSNTTSAEPQAELPVNFSVDVMSVLSKAGCNAGTCHGNLNGKGGMKLSLRGEDPVFDYHALVLASRGRRVNANAPAQSLLLRKATGETPHRGGQRFKQDSKEYGVLLDWIVQGTKAPSHDTPRVVRLDVEPKSAIVAAPNEQVAVSVTAYFADGSTRDVTDRACYELSNLDATVAPSGVVSRNKFCETTLIVRYLNKQVPVSIAFIDERPDFRWNAPKENNAIDQHVFAKLKKLRINPSEVCSDNVFVRRAFLDAIGRLPTADEAKDFVADSSTDKRSKLIDSLLSREEFADYWALKWADILRTEEKVLDPKGVDLFHSWIRKSIAEAKPVDQFVRELVTGTGSTFKEPPANFYRANRDPSTRGETTARLFLGTRLQCAKCHNHPFDRWTQDDYYRWSNLFSQIDYEVGENKRADKLDKNEFVGEQTVLVSKQNEVRNPTTGKVAAPKFLGGSSFDDGDINKRLPALGQWLTSPENRLFAQSQTNFVWYHVMGRGLVDPIDDFRLTNPPSNPPLMDWLSDQFVASGFDLRSLVRTIMNSTTYQLSTYPTASNRDDTTSYSRALVRRLPAEVILDMQSDVLGVPAKFVGYKDAIRAVQLPGVHKKRPRDEAPKSGDRFLKTFGKPERILACDCERSNETTLKQVFTLIGSGLSERLDDQQSRLGKLASSTQSNTEVIDELYWTALSRAPSPSEEAAALKMIEASKERVVALQDITWALLNAKEFLFRH